MAITLDRYIFLFCFIGLSMASVLLTAAGSAIGAAIPGVGLLAGPLLGYAGGLLGGAIDSALGLTPKIEGARQTSLRVQDSREGAVIPRLYGTLRVAGNVIWASDLIETRRTTRVSGGKGSSTSSTNYYYAVHLAVGVGAGPMAGLSRIWADSKLIYDAALNTTYADAVRFYNGSTTQNADALIQAIEGAANTPAYRGTAYVVLENLKLEHYGNRIPNLTFEVEGISGGFTPTGIASATPTVGTAAGDENPRRAYVTGPNSFIIAGIVFEAAANRFVVEHYTLANNTLTRTARITSTALVVNGNHSYALSADGTYLACCNCFASNGELALYNINAQSFSTILTPTLDALDSYAGSSVAWVDDRTLVVTAFRGARPAVLVFKRAGNALVNSGTQPAVELFTSLTITAFWLRTEPTRVLGTLTFFGGDNLRQNLSLARLQMQNGALRVVSTSPLNLGTSTYRLVIMPDDTLLVATISGNVTLRSYAVSTTGLSLTRAATTLAIPSTTIEDFLPLANNRVAVLSIASTQYQFAEITLTDTSFTLTGTPTNISGAPAASAGNANLRRMGGGTAIVQTDTLLAVMTPRRGDQSLAAILDHLASLTGLITPTFDSTNAGSTRVAGMAITDTSTAREAIEQLQQAYNFTIIETDGVLKATAYSIPTPVTIPAADRRASADDTVPPAVTRTRSQLQELPTAVQVDYLDSSNDYNTASRTATRHAPPYALLARLSLSIVLDATTAQQMADMRLARLLAEQETISLSVTRAQLALDSGDIISVDGLTYRLTSLTESGGVITLEAVRQVIGTLSATSTLTLTGEGSLLVPQPAELLALDLPPLTDSEDQPGIYFAASAATGWRGGIIYRSVNDETPAQYVRLGSVVIGGVATTALADGSTTLWDYKNTVTVALSTGTLTSQTALAVLNGTNAALLGNEIIQFQTATLISDSTYRLGGLLRGRRGTESATTTHAIGERFVLLDSDTLVFAPEPLTRRGQSVQLQLVTVGDTLATALAFPVSYNFQTLAPWSPVWLKAVRDTASGDITISWIRRARVNNEWVDYRDIPLDDTAESYVVEVMNGVSIARTFSPTTPAQSYTNAQQTADFGSLPASLTFRVAQISTRYGRGTTATHTIMF
jgi:hypothetical protein